MVHLKSVGRASYSPRWVPVLFLVVAATLVGSVLIPASETGHVLALLDEDESVIEPARRITARIESGIAEEASDLQRATFAGDSVSARRLRRRLAQDDGNLNALRALAVELDGGVAADVDSITASVSRWRTLARDASGARAGGAAFRSSAAARDGLRDSIDLAVLRVEAELDERAGTRRSAVRAHERRGLFLNAALVLIALVASGAVFETIRRERLRGYRERALRQMSESLAAAFTADDVAERIANAAVAVQSGRGACVAHIETARAGGPALVVRASAGSGVPGPGTCLPYPKSDAERANETGEPLSAADTIIIPLGLPESPVGVVLVRAATARGFASDDLTWASTFGHLASLACEKMRLLDEAREGRARLERMMERRSRLMRGFSHDVKNPLGVADGYAALLGDGIYGGITAEQQRSVERVRQSIHEALSLIEDVHEISRAETGNLSVRREPTDLGPLLHALADEYRPGARAKNLQLVVDIERELPAVDTDPNRIRQILANLLSNAIKYTEHGSVTLRGRALGHGGVSEVVIEVGDTGSGIPREWIPRLFEEFSRIPGTKQSGAGLGLAISKRVAEALGCTIDLESELGRGSTFVLRIPAQVAVNLAEDGAIPTRSAPLPFLPRYPA